MRNERVDFESLNAYIDGELDLARRAKIAEAIARGPLLAQQVAALTRLKSEVAKFVHAPDLELILPQRRPRPLRQPVVIIAGILVAIIAALGLFLKIMPGA